MSPRRAVTAETGAIAGVEKRLQHRLRRAEGQVRAVQRMIDEQLPCEEIITQLLAARSALDQVIREMLSSHVAECVATLPPDQAQAAVARAVGLLVRA
jgi:DNA-binding FrmR family transcriptional regulator